MKKENTVKFIFCFVAISLYLHSYLEAHNEVTKLRMELPKLTKQLRNIEEENLRFRYEIESFERPDHLMALIKTQEFSHFHYAQDQEILTICEGIDLNQELWKVQPAWEREIRPTVVLGAK